MEEAEASVETSQHLVTEEHNNCNEANAATTGEVSKLAIEDEEMPSFSSVTISMVQSTSEIDESYAKPDSNSNHEEIETSEGIDQAKETDHPSPKEEEQDEEQDRSESDSDCQVVSESDGEDPDPYKSKRQLLSGSNQNPDDIEDSEEEDSEGSMDEEDCRTDDTEDDSDENYQRKHLKGGYPDEEFYEESDEDVEPDTYEGNSVPCDFRQKVTKRSNERVKSRSLQDLSITKSHFTPRHFKGLEFVDFRAAAKDAGLHMVAFQAQRQSYNNESPGFKGQDMLYKNYKDSREFGSRFYHDHQKWPEGSMHHGNVRGFVHGLKDNYRKSHFHPQQIYDSKVYHANLRHKENGQALDEEDIDPFCGLNDITAKQNHKIPNDRIVEKTAANHKKISIINGIGAASALTIRPVVNEEEKKTDTQEKTIEELEEDEIYKNMDFLVSGGKNDDEQESTEQEKNIEILEVGTCDPLEQGPPKQYLRRMKTPTPQEQSEFQIQSLQMQIGDKNNKITALTEENKKFKEDFQRSQREKLSLTDENADLKKKVANMIEIIEEYEKDHRQQQLLENKAKVATRTASVQTMPMITVVGAPSPEGGKEVVANLPSTSSTSHASASFNSNDSSVLWTVSNGTPMTVPNVTAALNSDDSVNVNENTPNKLSDAVLTTSSRILKTLAKLTQNTNRSESPLAKSNAFDEMMNNLKEDDGNSRKRKANEMSGPSAGSEQPFKIPNTTGESNRRASVASTSSQANENDNDSEKNRVKAFVFNDNENDNRKAFLIRAAQSSDNQSFTECGPYKFGNVEIKMTEANGTINIWGRELSQEEANAEEATSGRMNLNSTFDKTPPAYLLNNFNCSTNQRPYLKPQFSASTISKYSTSFLLPKTPAQHESSCSTHYHNSREIEEDYCSDADGCSRRRNSLTHEESCHESAHCNPLNRSTASRRGNCCKPPLEQSSPHHCHNTQGCSSHCTSRHISPCLSNRETLTCAHQSRCGASVGDVIHDERPSESCSNHNSSNRSEQDPLLKNSKENEDRPRKSGGIKGRFKGLFKCGDCRQTSTDSIERQCTDNPHCSPRNQTPKAQALPGSQSPQMSNRAGNNEDLNVQTELQSLKSMLEKFMAENSVFKSEISNIYSIIQHNAKS